MTNLVNLLTEYVLDTCIFYYFFMPVNVYLIPYLLTSVTFKSSHLCALHYLQTRLYNIEC